MYHDARSHGSQIYGVVFNPVSRQKALTSNNIIQYFSSAIIWRSSQCRGWRRHCATGRKMAGPIPNVVIGILHLLDPSGRTIFLGSTHPLTERSTRNISLWVDLITLPSSCADCPEIWEPQLPGKVGTCPDLYRDCLTFITTCSLSRWACGLRRRSAAARFLGRRFRIPLWTWMFVCCVYCVLC